MNKYAILMCFVIAFIIFVAMQKFLSMRKERLEKAENDAVVNNLISKLKIGDMYYMQVFYGCGSDNPFNNCVSPVIIVDMVGDYIQYLSFDGVKSNKKDYFVKIYAPYDVDDIRNSGLFCETQIEIGKERLQSLIEIYERDFIK